MSSGHRRSSPLEGIADRTPNFRAAQADVTTPRPPASPPTTNAVPQVRVVKLLDGAEERIQVNVEDRARLRHVGARE
jgi:hypothetical protein